MGEGVEVVGVEDGGVEVMWCVEGDGVEGDRVEGHQCGIGSLYLCEGRDTEEYG